VRARDCPEIPPVRVILEIFSSDIPFSIRASEFTHRGASVCGQNYPDTGEFRKWVASDRRRRKRSKTEAARLVTSAAANFEPLPVNELKRSVLRITLAVIFFAAAFKSR
jgi:hypothetical protein